MFNKLQVSPQDKPRWFIVFKQCNDCMLFCQVLHVERILYPYKERLKIKKAKSERN